MAAGLVTVLALPACAATGDEVTGAPDGPATSIVYDCFGVRTTVDELRDAPSIAGLSGHPGLDAFVAATDDPDSWAAVLVEDGRLGAIRALDPPDVLDGEVRDHERLVVEHLGDAAGVEAVAEGWIVSSAGPCTLRADLEGLDAATVLLAPDEPPSPSAVSLELWVVERACASGMPATDRVDASVAETADEVRLIVGVEATDGDQTCPSNPPTPITVELDEPLGDRRIVDASRWPPIEVDSGPPNLTAGG